MKKFFVLMFFAFMFVSITGCHTGNNQNEESTQSALNTVEQGNQIDGPGASTPHFYYQGKTFVINSQAVIVTEVPVGYQLIGTATRSSDAFSGKDFEGNMSGPIYLSEDGLSAYVQDDSLEKINEKAALILCEVRN